MAPNKNLLSKNSSSNIDIYSRWQEIIRSCFWRFYDHLFQLVLCNFGWVLTCFSIAWISFHLGWVEASNQINFLQFYILYVVENIASIGWAYIVFKIFIEGKANFSDLWVGLRRYFFKASGISALSGFFIFLAIYNIYFYYFFKTTHQYLNVLLIVLTFWILVFLLASSLYLWPILFFQNPPFFKVFYKSWLLVLGNGLTSLGILIFFFVCFGLFSLVLFPWFFFGVVFFFAFQCMALEKHFLRYKITYSNKAIEPFLTFLQSEQQRSWREILKPWENR